MLLEHRLHTLVAWEIAGAAPGHRALVASQLAALPRELDGHGFWWAAYGDHGRRSTSEARAHRDDFERRVAHLSAIARRLTSALWTRPASDARQSLTAVATSDHWPLWHTWLSWREAPQEMDFAVAELADGILRECVVCADVRLELL